MADELREQCIKANLLEIGLESFAKAIHEAAPGDAMEKRVAVARACGYLDARFIVFLKETYGYPLDMAAMKAAECGLKICWSDVKHELLMTGMQEGGADAQIEEAQFILRDYGDGLKVVA